MTEEINPHVGRYVFAILFFAAGMFNASTGKTRHFFFLHKRPNAMRARVCVYMYTYLIFFYTLYAISSLPTFHICHVLCFHGIFIRSSTCI